MHRSKSLKKKTQQRMKVLQKLKKQYQTLIEKKEELRSQMLKNAEKQALVEAEQEYEQ